MSMKESLFKIIEAASGTPDLETLNLCEEFQEFCFGIDCKDCPLNNNENFDKLAVELEVFKL